MLRRPRTLILLLILLLALAASPGRAQEPELLYFPITGHHLADDYGFLSFWRLHGGEQILGLPVTELLEQGGRLVQYLERSRLEYDAALGQVQLGRLGAERSRWRSFPPAPHSLPSGSLRFAETGHTLGPPFRAFWEARGGVTVFGYPLSEPLWEAVGGSFYRVQYFERVRLEHHPVYAGGDLELQVSSLGLALAEAQGLSLGPVQRRAGALLMESSAARQPAREGQGGPRDLTRPQLRPTAVPVPTRVPTSAPPPTARPAGQPAPRPASGGPKLIDIDLSKQWLYAYEGEALVFSAPVATGKDGFNTPPGEFAVYSKIPLKTMRGTLGGETWDVPNVPSVMFIYGSVAIHGAYWHNLFGTGVRISHGCINMRLADAAWLYEWAPLETSVSVHY